MGISPPKIQRQIDAKNEIPKKGWPILREVNEKERKIKMRTICDVCERGAAILFCAADEAALCRACDHKVHNVNKLASRHVRVGLADPSDVPRCDICENAPAFFYCEVDGSSLCLQCDMVVHVGGKRTHGRFLLLRQRVQFPGDEPGQVNNLAAQVVVNTCGNGKNKAYSNNILNRPRKEKSVLREVLILIQG